MQASESMSTLAAALDLAIDQDLPPDVSELLLKMDPETADTVITGVTFKGDKFEVKVAGTDVMAALDMEPAEGDAKPADEKKPEPPKTEEKPAAPAAEEKAK